MKIDIEKIGPEGLDLDEPVTTAWLDDMLGDTSEFRPREDGRLTVHLARVDDAVHVRGRAHVLLGSACSRCLEPVELALDTPLRVTVVPREFEPQANDGGELTDEDVGISTYENREIDLTQVLRDEVFLELPMRALCNDDCAGLCVSCGKNLNEGRCPCAPLPDLRWDALSRIKLS